MLSAGGRLVFDEPAVGVGDALAEGDFRGPAERFDFGDVEEFAGGAVGFGAVELEGAFEAEDFADGFGEFADGDVFAAADVDQVGLIVAVEEEEAGVGEVVGVEEFSAGVAAAPDGDAFGAGLFGFVDFADEGGENVGVAEVVVVMRTVKIGRHG